MVSQLLLVNRKLVNFAVRPSKLCTVCNVRGLTGLLSKWLISCSTEDVSTGNAMPPMAWASTMRAVASN
jgi:hypothetical protein